MFAKAAGKSHITEQELCSAIRQVIVGQADDLGGGVFKKRLNKNRDRSIILARSKSYWIYEYLFSKKDRANISSKELMQFRNLAGIYDTYTGEQVQSLLANKDWKEICHENSK